MDSEEEQLARAIALSLEATPPAALQTRANGGELNTLPEVGQQTTESTGREPELSSPDAAYEWLPNLDAMQVLLSMGISENAAKRALYFTGNSSADHAATWVFENLETPDLHKPFSPPTVPPKLDAKTLQAILDESRVHKMVFIVNTSLGMGVGKIAAQVGHATLALYKTLLVELSDQLSVRDWEEKGAKKVVLKGDSTEHLLALKMAAESKHIPCFLVRDAGKTQVKAGSITVLALFGKGYLVDEVSGRLSTL